MLIVRIKTDNAAFEDKSNECAWILSEIVEKINNDETAGPCVDSNGNKVGVWSLGSNGKRERHES